MPPRKRFPVTQGALGAAVDWKTYASGICKVYIHPLGLLAIEATASLREVTDDLRVAVWVKVHLLGYANLLPAELLRDDLLLASVLATHPQVCCRCVCPASSVAICACSILGSQSSSYAGGPICSRHKQSSSTDCGERGHRNSIRRRA